MNDQQLVSACLKHDRNSQKQLYEKYSGQMYSVCLRYCKDEHHAQEALQNGFIKVFSNLDAYRNDGPLAAWIRRIVVRAAIDQLDIAKRYKSIFSSIEMQQLASDHYMDWHETMTYDELLKLINTIPEGYKLVFSMFVLDDMSHAEIAEALGIEETTSRTQLKKARNYIKKLMLEKNISI